MFFPEFVRLVQGFCSNIDSCVRQSAHFEPLLAAGTGSQVEHAPVRAAAGHLTNVRFQDAWHRSRRVGVQACSVAARNHWAPVSLLVGGAPQVKYVNLQGPPASLLPQSASDWAETITASVGGTESTVQDEVCI